MHPQIDQERTKQFAGKLLGIYTGCALTKLIDIGHQTGLFDAGAKCPGTSQELAERTGLNERYVREWLGAMTTGGIFTYEPASRTYSLPLEHAALLSGDTARNMAPMSQMLNVFGRNLPQLVDCFRSGGGIPHTEFRGFVQRMADAWRRIYDEHLINGFLPAARGLPERLRLLPRLRPPLGPCPPGRPAGTGLAGRLKRQRCGGRLAGVAWGGSEGSVRSPSRHS